MKKFLIALTALFAAISANAQSENLKNMMNTENLTLAVEWDKTFPQSDKVDHSKVTFVNRYGITLAADLYKPRNATGRLAAIAVSGPFGAVKPCAADEAERSSGRVAHGKRHTGSLIATSLQFEVEEHHKLLRLRIIKHLGTLHDAATFNIVPRLFAHRQGKALVLPHLEVFRRIDPYPRLGSETTVGAVLPIPIICVPILNDVTTMRIDVVALSVHPELTIHMSLRLCVCRDKQRHAAQHKALHRL